MRTIIEMARQAGIRDCTCDGTKGCLGRFAAFVRADERERAMRENAYVLAEREACAKVCDARAIEYDGFTEEQNASEKLAAAIRARGDT